jgi:hypothetical protein
MGSRKYSPTKPPQNAEEFKRDHGIGQGFESKATDFFTSK